MKCYGCEKRTATCHARCPDYLEFRDKRDKLLQERLKNSEQSVGLSKRYLQRLKQSR